MVERAASHRPGKQLRGSYPLDARPAEIHDVAQMSLTDYLRICATSASWTHQEAQQRVGAQAWEGLQAHGYVQRTGERWALSEAGLRAVSERGREH